YARLSEQNAALKELARRVLVPYARAWYGPLLLVISGRSLSQEEAAFGALLDRRLGGKKSERLRALSELTRVAVALRALAARRWLERLLAAWLPLHLALSALLVVLLAAHVAGALR
ncbi:MAG TPA: hypothetical protein VGQ57_12215, partial [Polyangiaceae bacterium]|nr:hypothetical protein [Polyangiaceae bacterium]